MTTQRFIEGYPVGEDVYQLYIQANQTAGNSPATVLKVRQQSGDNESESDFQKRVIDKAHEHGWKVCEFRKARIKKDGKDVYRTPFGADGKGFPDLVLARDGVVLFRELKSDSGAADPEQVKWLIALGGAIWQPKYWQQVCEELKEETIITVEEAK